MSYAADLDRVMRMARKQGDPGVPVSVADMHPSLRFTRLGAHLRKTANEGGRDDISNLARATLLSNHDQPLELMPLRMLRDALLENGEHPLAKEFNWETLPKNVELDEHLKREIANHNSSLGVWTGREMRITPHLFRHGIPVGSTGSIRVVGDIVTRIMKANPDVTLNDLDDSASRIREQMSRENHAILTSAEHPENADPEAAGVWHDNLANNVTSDGIPYQPFRHDHPERY